MQIIKAEPGLYENKTSDIKKNVLFDVVENGSNIYGITLNGYEPFEGFEDLIVLVYVFDHIVGTNSVAYRPKSVYHIDDDLDQYGGNNIIRCVLSQFHNDNNYLIREYLDNIFEGHNEEEN